jgi:hypothetical protein
VKENRIPKQRCAACGYRMDKSTEAFGDAAPKPGDVSICLACGAVQVFTADLTLRNPTRDEHEKFSRDQRIIDVQMARAHVVGDNLKRRKR